MKSIKIGSISGIPVELRPSFLIILALILIQSLSAGSWEFFIGAMSFVSVIWGTVFLHEIGHCWMARRVGWKCNAIGIWLLGGVAEIGLNPFEPKKELKVALAGPAVNVLLFFLFWPLLLVFQKGAMHELTLWFLQFNVLLVLFNMIPALPMDGGRVLRSWLTMWNGDTVLSTCFCKNLAYVLAVFMAAFAFYNPFMILIALFIIFAATHEYNHIARVDYIMKEAKAQGYECELPTHDGIFNPRD